MTSTMFDRMDRMSSYSFMSSVGSGLKLADEATGLGGMMRLLTSGTANVEGGGCLRLRGNPMLSTRFLSCSSFSRLAFSSWRARSGSVSLNPLMTSFTRAA